eukprot:gene16082-17705_t
MENVFKNFWFVCDALTAEYKHKFEVHRKKLGPSNRQQQVAFMMIDQAYGYIGTIFDKIKDFHAPITLEELGSRAGIFKTDLNEYEIITRRANSGPTDSDANDDDCGDGDNLGYAVARSTPFKTFHQQHRRTVDGISTSDNHFPTLFHQQTCSVITSDDSISIIRQPTPVREDPLDSMLWREEQRRGSNDEDMESVYQKVADWVFSQRHYFHRFDPDDVDDIEVIDPVDLFHDSLLDEYLVLVRTSSEKRVILRELPSHAYDFLSVHEAMEKCEFDFLRKPDAGATLELSRVGIECEGASSNQGFEESDVGQEAANDNRPFLAVTSALNNYSVYDKDGDEISLHSDSFDKFSLTDETNENEANNDGDTKSSIKASDVNEIDIVSMRCLTHNVNFDEQTSAPTDIFDITTNYLADIASDYTEDSDVWEDAKDIPHWLDSSEHDDDDVLFNHPHRPFYYYRDRIKGCYRIIGVEDETVVLFSGNDDDSIFYSTEKEDEVSALRRSHSLGLLPSSSANNKVRTKLFSPSNAKPRIATKVTFTNEKRNDSGIEDAEEFVVGDENDTFEASLSAKESRDLGRVTKIIKNKEPKTVTFRMDDDVKKSRQSSVK